MSGSLLYLDACTIIYLHEGEPAFHAAVMARLVPYRQRQEARLVTSRLSRLECRVRPIKVADGELLSRYDAFFAANRLVLGEITAAVVDRATDLRARFGFKAPDAIHLATAIEHGTDVFLTGDQGLARCTDVRVEVLSP